MLDTWDGSWDSGYSCWTLGKEAGIVEIFMLDTWDGGWDSGPSCWALGRRLG